MKCNVRFAYNKQNKNYLNNMEKVALYNGEKLILCDICGYVQ